jgi:hypothetical protein
VGDRPECAESDASVATEAGGSDFKRAVILAGLEGDHLPVWRTAVLGFELTVDQAVRRAEFAAAARLWDDRELDLGTIAEVVGAIAKTFAGEVLLLPMRDSA